MIRYHHWFLWSVLCLAGTASSHPGQHEQLDHINSLIAQQPDQQILYIRRGSIYATGAQFEQAMADFEQAERLGPAVQVALERGMAYYQMQEFDLATQYLDRYLQQFPHAAIAYEYRSRIARQKGDVRQAIADLHRYFELQDQPHPGNYLAAADMLHELHETAQALNLLDQGLDKLGLVPQLQQRAIELELERGTTAAAIARFATLRIPLQNSPSWKLQMAELLLLDDRHADAGMLLNQAETELRKLRPTPARIKLLQQVLALKKKLAAPVAATSD